MKSLLKLMPYLRPYFWLIALSTFLAIPLSVIRLGPAPVVRYMLDNVLVHKDQGKLLLFSFAIIGLYLLNFIIRFAHYFLLRIVVARVDQQIKNRIFKHLLGLSADYFTTQN